MLPRKYIFPNVIELNLQAGRSLGVNIYLIDGGREFVLIDIGQDETLDDIVDLIRRMDFPLSKCKMIIATHADADHVQALPKARERFRTKTAAHPEAAKTLAAGDSVQTFAKISAQNIDIPMPAFKIDSKLKEGDTIPVGDLHLHVWHTPGHTPGQLSFKLGNLLFSGDNIYADACVGVIDAHHGSNIPHFIQSLERILADDAEYLLPSHGPMFRKDPVVLTQAIERLRRYQYMADFGTCAIDWPLQREWEKTIASGKSPIIESEKEAG
jgi:hydroxyacylglutathione hydrolase